MKSALALVGTIVLAAPQVALARPRVDAAGHLIRDAHSCGTTSTPSANAVSTPFAAPARRTIYLNRMGGTYNVAGNATSSATNAVSTIASGDGRAHANAVIPPLEASFNWPYIVDCIKKQYKPYNIIVTETEPTSGSYVEAVVGGNGSSMGWSASSGILGVAAADNFCGVTEKGIAFNFSTNHLGIAKANDELCTTIAHEIGHLLALEHEIAPADTMSYVPFASVNQKSFTSPSSQCGTDAQNTRNCSCPTTGAGQVTSSGMRLTQFVGLRPIETTPPKLEVTAPGNDNTVRPSFTVTADASDETGMEQVTVLLDGTMAGASSAPAGTTYSIPMTNIAEGPHAIEVQAIDLAGNITKKQLTVKVALGNTGDSCAIASDCRGNICALEADGTNFCTQACGDGNSCSGDFSCEPVGEQQICVPDGGGCSVGGGSGSTFALLLGAWLVLRRRGRSAR
jgi:hypothetical protein